MTAGGRERTLAKLQIGHESEMFDKPNEEGHTHRWTCFVRPVAPVKFTDRSFINKVKFYLHESYKDSTRTVRDPPFEVTETGFGSFPLQLEIYFNYPGAKAVKYRYDMLLQMTKKGHASEEATLELKNAPAPFGEMAKKYGTKRKRSSGTEETTNGTTSNSGNSQPQSMFPPLKMTKIDASKSPREIIVRPFEEDRFSRELRLQEKERKERDKERERKREKDREKHRAERERRETERKRLEEKERAKELEKRKAEKPKSPIVEKIKKESPSNFMRKESPSSFIKKESPSSFMRKESPSVKKESPSGLSPSIRPGISSQKPTIIKHAPSKTTSEERKPFSESDLSSPSTSYGSITPRTPLSLQGGGHILPLNEIQRRIAALTDEEQVFRVATLLLSLPGTNLLPSKPSLSFDVDLSTVEPSLLSRLCDALS